MESTQSSIEPHVGNTSLRSLIICAAFSFALLSCATVKTPNIRGCTVAGVFQGGMDCAESNTGIISEMGFQEMIDWLEPQPERVDPVTGNVLPARAGAVCHSDDDFTANKIALEQACELLKTRCTPEMKAAIVQAFGGMETVLEKAQKKKLDPFPAIELLDKKKP